MRFTSSILAIAAVVAGAAAQTTHQVTVGQGGLVFTPNNFTAAVNDLVTFVFYAKNHTVTQSAFAAPCAPLVNTTTNAVGFDSGFVPVSANASSNPSWTIKVTDTKPIWFFCRQSTHCQSGMVGAINAPATGNTFDAYLASAKGAAGQNTAAASVSGAASTGAGATPASSSGAAPSGSASGTSAASTTTFKIGSAASGIAAVALVAAVFM
jgi:plastocyanin